MVVEDNFDLRDNLAFQLEMMGYAVVQAEDGQHALDILRDSEALPDIVLSDIAMPHVDGFQLLEQLRGNPAWKAIPFLFLTAYNSPDYVKHSEELRADDFLVKPVKPDALMMAIKSKLNE
jgi:CheY-like chemotaxis protein